jgi:hypothetical protein
VQTVAAIITQSVLAMFPCVVLMALLAAYVPTIYIRKTDQVIKLLEKVLEQIEASNRREMLAKPQELSGE